MGSAWGLSWGRSWLDTWGATEVAHKPVGPPYPAGRIRIRRIRIEAEEVVEEKRKRRREVIAAIEQAIEPLVEEPIAELETPRVAVVVRLMVTLIIIDLTDFIRQAIREQEDEDEAVTVLLLAA